MSESKENSLHLSWHDSAWIPHLNPTNILDYFSERSNPFYDRTCNNEIVKMQKLSFEQLQNMSGLEYILLHVQEPILYVIRKQHRHSQSQVTPLADYYIIAGYVYQAPDLNSFISSRLASSIHYLQSAFDEANSYMRYHPTKGYTWDFGKDSALSEYLQQNEKKKEKQRDEASSTFQRARVDSLLGELLKKFPPKQLPNSNAPIDAQRLPGDAPAEGQTTAEESNKTLNETEAKVSTQNGNNFTNRPVVPEKKPRLA